jgi:hypothetical protein
MAAQTDITVKMNDGATNITYTKLTPSGADGQAAQWRSESVGGVAGQRPAVSLLSKWNGPKTVRRLEGEVTYPQVATDSTTGLTQIVNTVKLQLIAHIPVGTPQAVIDEAVSQGLNIFADANSFKVACKSGYAPT